MKHVSKTTYLFLLIFAVSLLLFVISSVSEKACVIIDVKICQRIRLALSSFTSFFSLSVFELFVFLSPLLIFLILRYVARGDADAGRRFLKVLSVFSLLLSSYILTLGISYNAPSRFSEYGAPVSREDLVFAANTLKDSVNCELEFITYEPTFDVISTEAAKAFSATSEKFGLAAGNLPRPKPLVSSRLVSYTGALAIYSYPTGEININTNAPSYTVSFTVLHELAHSLGAVGEADANFLAYIVSLDSDSHFLRYSVALSVLEYILSDIKGLDYDAYCKCLEGLSERARGDINSWNEYSQKYHNSILFRAFDSSNTRHLERWDKKGAAAYSAVSVYVTNYLRSA